MPTNKKNDKKRSNINRLATRQTHLNAQTFDYRTTKKDY